MIVRNRRIRQLRANCPLYDDLISEDSSIFGEIDLSIFDKTFLEEVDPVDFLKEVKEDVNLGCSNCNFASTVQLSTISIRKQDGDHSHNDGGVKSRRFQS